jgi:hypothetical protein
MSRFDKSTTNSRVTDAMRILVAGAGLPDWILTIPKPKRETNVAIIVARKKGIGTWKVARLACDADTIAFPITPR